MITISQISVGKGYLTRHLSANDYYSEGETVTGQWQGKGAEMLGLSGDVEEAAFESLRNNRHPGSGEKLTARKSKVAFHDIVFSAPKSVSVAAIVGGDERLVEAFRQSVETTFKEMEKLAAVRVRTGNQVHTEATRKTGNVIAGVFHHDSSRALDPQLHAHAVLANASFDATRNGWFALQPVHMIIASKTGLRSLFYHDLAKRVSALGYEVEWRGRVFRLKGLSEKLDLTFSQRAIQRQRFEQRYRTVFGKLPTKRRVEQFIKEGHAAAVTRFHQEHFVAFGWYPAKGDVNAFVKDWRDLKLTRISTAQVRKRQRERISAPERYSLNATVSAARRNVAESTTEEKPHFHQEIQQQSVSGESLTKRIRRASRSVTPALAGQVSRLTRTLLDGLKPRPDTGVVAARQLAQHKAQMSRTEVLRRVRQGRRLAQAMRGIPHGMAKHAIRSQAIRSRRNAA